MIENLREIILNRIAEVIKREDYKEVYADGKRPALEELEVLNKLLQNVSETPEVSTPCSKCPNYLESLRTGKMLVCNCTLGLPSITCNYEYKGNIE